MLTAPAPAIVFRAATARELPAVSAFLARRFQLADGASLVDERHLTWKYWRERADWAGPRSFTARSGGRIVAHAAAWPVAVRAGAELVRAVHLIDWAASPEWSGAGVWLARQIRRTVPLMIATGGSDLTRRLLPTMGFRPHGDLSVFARPVRPLGLAMTAGDRTWKLPARLARNTAWRAVTPLAAPRGWSAVPVAPEDLPDHLWPQPSEQTAVSARDARLLRYLLEAPTTRYVMYGLARGGELVGYSCVSFVGHVARIADLWLPSTQLEDWTAAFAAACAAAGRERSVYEVWAWASTRLGRAALARSGFRERERLPLTLAGDVRALGGRELHVQMIDCDASFLTVDSGSYLT